ncbi:autotransporter outer membrane beta-barrel domain-containing protein [Mesorhizobium amorphae]|uniref:autotransporter outer membrane beta-barrel domain-containing protein n=1 Tax=Mesorhizobium amorphae TaxID=71433 RepID=UPI00118700B4|nr:autotransporter domain-containing protein [Mesorhizobium amorphae]
MDPAAKGGSVDLKDPLLTRYQEAPKSERFAAWSEALGGWGSYSGDGNAARLEHSLGGVLFGLDGAMGDNWRVGVAGGYSRTSFDVDARKSSGSANSYHLMAYAGTQLDAIGLRFGVGHSWHDVKTDRSVAFGGFADKLSASYDASTTYAFGEVGYAMVMDRVTFEPFANVAFVHLDTDGFTESGGPAALTSNGETRNIPYTTLGLRAGTDMLLGGTTLRLDGMVGWQHAYNNVVPGESFALKGSDLFNVSGVPIARDAFLLEAGTSWRPADNVTLGLTYSGQFASGSRDHGFKGTLSVKF